MRDDAFKVLVLLLCLWTWPGSKTARANDTTQVGQFNRKVYQLLIERQTKEALLYFDSIPKTAIAGFPENTRAVFHLNRAFIKYEQKSALQTVGIIDSLQAYPSLGRFPFIGLRLMNLKIRSLRSIRKVAETIELTDTMIAKAMHVSSHRFMGMGYYYKARAFEDLGQYDKAIVEYEKALRKFTMMGGEKMLAITYKSLGIVYRKMGVYSSAIENYLGALRAYGQLNDDKGVASVYNSMGILAATNKDYDRGIEYLKKALDSQAKGSVDQGIAPNIYNNLGACYLGKEDYDSAAIVLIDGLGISERIQNTREIGIAVNNLGIAYKGQGDYAKAKQYYYRAIRLKKVINRVSSLPSTYLGLGHAHFLEGNMDSAKHYYGFLEEQAETAPPKFKTEIYSRLAEFYETNGRYQEAYLAMDSLRRFTDLLHREQEEHLAHNYESLFNLKASELEKTKLQNALSQGQLEASSVKEKARLRGILFSLSLVVLGLVLIMIVRVLVNRRKLERSYKEMAKVNEQLEESLEENRGIMSVVAHDLRSPLMQIKGLLDILKDESDLGDEQLSYLHTIDKVYSSSLDLIGDLTLAHSHETKKIILAPTDLEAVIRESVKRFKGQANAKEITLEWNTSGLLKGMSNVDHLTRIIDNLISNAIKFSPKAKVVRIDLMDSDSYGVISVSDEGPGISVKEQERLFKRFEKLSNRPTAGEASSGLGLFIVKSLADEIGAKVTVNSVQGAGSRFSVVVPK